MRHGVAGFQDSIESDAILSFGWSWFTGHHEHINNDMKANGGVYKAHELTFQL